MAGDYFVLSCVQPPDWEDCAGLKGIPAPPGSFSWRVGQRFKVPPQQPIQVGLQAHHCDRLRTYYSVDAIVMTKAMLAALRAAGVHNLDVYQAVVRHPTTGFETHDYVAVNLIGLVSAVDFSKSKVVGGSPDHLLDTDFEGFAVDPRKTHGFLMFRLAENTSAVMIHRSVKDHLEREGFDQLQFIPPEQFVG